MTSCIVFLISLGLVAGTTVVIPFLGAIADSKGSKPSSVIDPGFPARSFEAKSRVAATEAKDLAKKAWNKIIS